MQAPLQKKNIKFIVLFLQNNILGLIDGHTHPVWVGDRVHEFAMKVTNLYETYQVTFLHEAHLIYWT